MSRYFVWRIHCKKLVPSCISIYLQGESMTKIRTERETCDASCLFGILMSHASLINFWFQYFQFSFFPKLMLLVLMLLVGLLSDCHIFCKVIKVWYFTTFLSPFSIVCLFPLLSISSLLWTLCSYLKTNLLRPSLPPSVTNSYLRVLLSWYSAWICFSNFRFIR